MSADGDRLISVYTAQGGKSAAFASSGFGLCRSSRMAENAWNTRDRVRVALACTPHSRWRNRVEFLQGGAEIEPLPDVRRYLSSR